MKIRTLYIGGGTPSSIASDLLEKLLQTFAITDLKNLEEFTIEANPESIDKEFILLCKKYYVTRLSIGVQTTHDECLKVLGRKTSFQHIEKAGKLIHHFWNGDVSIDLITGIPGQSFTMLKHDILYCINEFKPGHISLYSLTIEKGTVLYDEIKNNRIVQLPQQLQDSLWLRGAGLIESFNFINYEISNFAKKGKESIHNIRYWEIDPYIGIGPGAAGTLPGTNKRIIRISHPKDITDYVSQKGSPWGIIFEWIDKKEFLFETCMMGFRLQQGIQSNKFLSRFNVSFMNLFHEVWDEWKQAGYVQSEKPSYALTKKGRLLLNRLLVELSEYCDDINENNLVVHWPETIYNTDI